MELSEQLLKFGMINQRVFAGIQIDIGRVAQNDPNGGIRDGQLCDHNCTTVAPTRAEGGVGSLVVLGPTGGNYICPSSSSLNRNMDPKAFAKAETIVKWVTTEVTGHRLARNELMRNLKAYKAQFCISDEALNTIINGITAEEKTVEVNVFGGNPEMHPEAATIISRLRDQKLVVNFTTTGRRLMRDEKFFEAISKHPPNMFAFSIDDLSAEDVQHLAQLSLEEIEEVWKNYMRQNPNHGQRLKAIEGFYAAKKLQDKGIEAVTLFNMVIHPGNLNGFKELLAAVAHVFPKALCNPYNVQSSFEYGTKNYAQISYTEEQLQSYEQLNDWLIEQTVLGNPNITKRLHFYLFMKAIFTRFQGQRDVLSSWISGHEGWKCYKNAGAGRYLQIGGSPNRWGRSKQEPGGHRGCFWNERTVTQYQQINQDPFATVNYIMGDAKLMAARKTEKCPGCIMPRLMFDVLSTELGMNDHIIPAYLQLRKKYVGY